MVRNENAQHEAFDEKDAASRYVRYAEEARKFFVGPMPPMDFVTQFLPKAANPAPHWTKAFADVPTQANKEEELYRPLVCAQVHASMEFRADSLLCRLMHSTVTCAKHQDVPGLFLRTRPPSRRKGE